MTISTLDEPEPQLPVAREPAGELAEVDDDPGGPPARAGRGRWRRGGRENLCGIDTCKEKDPADRTKLRRTRLASVEELADGVCRRCSRCASANRQRYPNLDKCTYSGRKLPPSRFGGFCVNCELERCRHCPRVLPAGYNNAVCQSCLITRANQHGHRPGIFCCHCGLRVWTREGAREIRAREGLMWCENCWVARGKDWISKQWDAPPGSALPDDPDKAVWPPGYVEPAVMADDAPKVNPPSNRPAAPPSRTAWDKLFGRWMGDRR